MEFGGPSLPTHRSALFSNNGTAFHPKDSSCVFTHPLLSGISVTSSFGISPEQKSPSLSLPVAYTSPTLHLSCTHQHEIVLISQCRTLCVALYHFPLLNCPELMALIRGASHLFPLGPIPPRPDLAQQPCPARLFVGFSLSSRQVGMMLPALAPEKLEESWDAYSGKWSCWAGN